MPTITISSKVSDRLCIYSEDDSTIDYKGYVPEGLGIGDDDYLDIEIDLETGQIIGWTPLTLERVKAAIANR